MTVETGSVPRLDFFVISVVTNASGILNEVSLLLERYPEVPVSRRLFILQHQRDLIVKKCV